MHMPTVCKTGQEACPCEMASLRGKLDQILGDVNGAFNQAGVAEFPHWSGSIRRCDLGYGSPDEAAAYGATFMEAVRGGATNGTAGAVLSAGRLVEIHEHLTGVGLLRRVPLRSPGGHL